MAKSKIKTIIMVVAILLALALAGGWIAQTVVSKQKGTVQAEASENAKDGMQVDLDNDGNEVQLMSALIAEADYDEYGVSALAESAYTLHATVTPDNVSNKDLTWSLSFANPTSSWANGKTPSTYVSMTSLAIRRLESLYTLRQRQPLIALSQQDVHCNTSKK